MSYPPLSRLNIKPPSALVTVPLVVLSANTEAPSKGSFVSASITLPVTENWEKQRRLENDNSENRAGFFIEY